MQPAENMGGQWGIKKTKPDILFPKQKGGKSMDKNGQNLSGSKTKNLSVYDDGNIPEVDLPLPMTVRRMSFLMRCPGKMALAEKTAIKTMTDSALLHRG